MDDQINILQELDKINNFNTLSCSIDNLGKYLPHGQPNFSLLTQNIRSVHKASNIDDLEINLSLLNQTVDLIVLTECRINSDKPLPCKDNYLTYSSVKKTNQNDGVVVFIKTSIKHSVKEIDLLHGASCLEITTPFCSVICIYRTYFEKNPEQFINSLDVYLNSPHLNKNVILTGDININIISGLYNKLSEVYLNMLASHGLEPGHRLNTRINSSLDHMFLNVDLSKFSITVAVLDTSITDHKMVLSYFYCKTKITHTSPYKQKTIVSYPDALKTLQSKDLSDFCTIKDPNIFTTKLITLITDCLNENTKTTNVPRSKRILKPWITEGILKCIKNRNILQKKSRKEPTNEILKISYRRYRNFCNNLIKKLKKQYEYDLLNKAKGNNKTLWNCIKHITNYHNKQKNNNVELLNLKNTPKESANYINNYFNNVGRTLAEQIKTNLPQQSHNYDDIPSQANSIGVIDIEPFEIESIINSLKTESAVGWDKIPTRFLKLAKPVLVPLLVCLGNLIFDQGIFPRDLKRSIIHPIYKSGDRGDINNYRPISVLPVVSKIMEKLINSRLLGFLNTFGILSKNQYGFRTGINTESAISDLTRNITTHLDNRKKALCIFLDLKKAFDTVSIPTLLYKLNRIGIRGTFLTLLTDYLQDRSNIVKLDNYSYSDVNNSNNYGVPQGSVLGPTLFLIYINDLTNLKLANGCVFSYADDTALLFHGDSWPKVFAVAETGLTKVMDWLNLNLLSLNMTKTNYITFSIRDSTQPDSDFTITAHTCNKNVLNSCNCYKLERVNHTKYLGVILDKNLSWYPQLDVVANRARKFIWLFKHLREIADKELIIYIYMSLVQSLLLYCIPIWGGTYKTTFINIERVQRLILKVILRKKRLFGTNLLYKEANVLTVRQLYVLQCILYVHKNYSFNPKLLNKRKVNTVVRVDATKTKFARKQFSAQSVLLYNKINRTLNLISLPYFACKKKVTTWLKLQSYEDIENLLAGL